MARSISHAEELRTLIFPTFRRWRRRERDENPVPAFLKGFMGGLLQISGDTEDFTWAKAYNLTKITVAIHTFTIGNGFIKSPQKEMDPPLEIRKGDRAVWLQNMRVNEGWGQWYYTADNSWASQIMTAIK